MTSEQPGHSQVDELFARLESSIKAGNPNAALPAVVELGTMTTERNLVPDELLERVLSLLQTREALESQATATVLLFFEFQLLSLSKVQRRRCMEVLSALSDQLVDGDALYEARQAYDRLLIAKD
jgi:hypothetical protein